MESVVNVGAGAGSYESKRTVLAVEPSMVMINQRRSDAAPAVCARAEDIPVASKSVDAALAVLTIHHWGDLRRGVSEMVRIARRRIVILTWDHQLFRRFWLLREYLPAAARTDQMLSVPIDELRAMLPGFCRTVPVPVPHDCVDGFGGAYWCRPAAYLDPAVRAGMSMLALTPRADLAAGLAELRADVISHAWERRHPDLTELHELDLGYRLLIIDL